VLGCGPNLSAFLNAGYACPVCYPSQKKIGFRKLATRKVCASSMSAVCSEARTGTMWCSFRGSMLAQYAASDRMAEAYAMVSLMAAGCANQVDDRAGRLLVRYARCGGISGVSRPGGIGRLGTSGTTATRLDVGGWVATRERLVQRLKADGVDQREIARRIGVSEKAIPQTPPAFGGGSGPRLFSAKLPLETVPHCGPKPVRCLRHRGKFGAQPGHRSEPSLRRPTAGACLGLLVRCAAALWFRHCRSPRGRALLALPLVVSSGVLACAQKIYGSLGPAFYGLRNSLLTLLLMALWRIKRPKASRNTRRKTWPGHWGWTGRRKSKRCGAS